MPRSIGRVVLLAGLLGTTGVPAHAAAGKSLNAAIPFGFGAGDKEFASGNCKFEISSGASQLSIRCSKTSAVVQAVSLKFMGDVFKDPPKNEMVFNRYGDVYFLAQVWIGHQGMEVAKSAGEKEAEKGGEAKVIKLKVKAN
jgi:hypothetical protein